MCVAWLSAHASLQVWVRDAVEAQYFLDYRTGRVWHKDQVHQKLCCALILDKAMLVFIAFVTWSYLAFTVVMTIIVADVIAACWLRSYWV